jgi:hypothetical protein
MADTDHRSGKKMQYDLIHPNVYTIQMLTCMPPRYDTNVKAPTDSQNRLND